MLRQLAAQLPVAHTRPGWLPRGTGLVGLDKLGAEHRRLLGVRGEVGAALHALRVRFEQEDVARQHALQAGYRSGRDEKVPKVTPPQVREHELAAAEERLVAANL